MTNAEIISNLRNCLAELSLINQSEELKTIEQSRFYSTTNDVLLGDAINIISEVICAVEDAEKYELKATASEKYQLKATAIASHLMAQLKK